MRRPKRHQSKAQLRCNHLKTLIRFHRQQTERLINSVDELSSELKLAKQDWLENDRNLTLLRETRRRCEDLHQQITAMKSQVEMAQKIIDRAATIDFERCENGYYQISVTFNGDFMGGISRYGEVQRHVARRVAEQIEHEIASSKFVETARQNQLRRMDQEMMNYPRVTPYGQ